MRLGRLGGVRIGLHWSLLVIVVLLGAGLAHDRLPFDAPGHGGVAYAIAGALTALGLVVGILAHEAGHAVVARRAGLRVDGITLSWVGGVTRMEGDTKSPWWEVAVAGVGPAVSAALGGALLAARAVGGGDGGGIGGGVAGAAAPGSRVLILAAIGWLGVINLSLAVFNLVPAAPLDGGRVLHGLVWRITGDRWGATRLTSRIGIGFGAVVVAVGVVALTSRRDGLDAVVLAALGWWLIGAARTEGRSATVQRALEGATVADLMRPVGAAPGWLTISAFVDGYDSRRPGVVWLLERWGGGYDGVVDGEVVRAVAPRQWAQRRPIDVATPITEVAGASPGEDALTCLVRTGGTQVVLVVDGGHTVGAVLPTDVEALVASGRQAVRTGGAPAPRPAR